MFHLHRSPRWRHVLLDGEDRPLRDLDGITGGRVEAVALSRLGGSGSLSLDDREHPIEIDWLSHRVQSIYDPGIPGVEAWPVSTMLFTSPTMTQHDGYRSYAVELLTKLSVVDEDSVGDVYSLPAGTPIIATVVSLIESTGEDRIAVTPSDAVLKNPQAWDAGESKLTIINELLEAAGYWSLWCDGSGMFRVEPYRNPLDRPVSYEFVQGEASIHEPEWGREQDLFSVPNRFLVIGQGSDNEPPLVGEALNEDPESPYSFQARGRWITRTEEGVEGESQSVFDQLAQRRLLDAMDPVARLTVTHAILPLEPNQLIRFADSGTDVRATIQRLSYDFGFDSQCRAEWREA